MEVLDVVVHVVGHASFLGAWSAVVEAHPATELLFSKDLRKRHEIHAARAHPLVEADLAVLLARR